jgi:hypothetical protein
MVIEKVGENEKDIVFRFPEPEFSQVFFSMTEQELAKYWEKI